MMNQRLSHSTPLHVVLLSTQAQRKAFKRILGPVKNILVRIKEQRLKDQMRRRSCNCCSEGMISSKQMRLINVPSAIDQHIKRAGPEFALQSFQEIFKRQQRRQTKQATILQVDMQKYQKQETIIEQPIVARPPSASSPVKLPRCQTKPKPKNGQTYIQHQGVRLKHYFTSSLARSAHHTLLPVISIESPKAFPLLDLTKVDRYRNKHQSQQFNSCRSTIHDRPYLKQNELLTKLIQTQRHITLKQ